MGNSRENEVSRTFILEAKVQGSAEQIGEGSGELSLFSQSWAMKGDKGMWQWLEES